MKISSLKKDKQDWKQLLQSIMNPLSIMHGSYEIQEKVLMFCFYETKSAVCLHILYHNAGWISIVYILLREMKQLNAALGP